MHTSHRRRRLVRAALLPLAAFLVAAAALSAVAGETSQAQPYEKIRYPTFKDGRLETLLEADQAEAYDLTVGTPRINLRNVIITIYDNSPETRARTPEDQPLPVRMVITSDRGYFTRRPPEPGTPPEEIANLEGNVIVRQMRVSPNPIRNPERRRRLDPNIETEIRCQHAQWNNTLRKLNGDGDVEFIHEDSRITGTGFLYLADDEALTSGASSSNIKDWGGIVFIEHNAQMEINREDSTGLPERTTITCKDTASYKLREREIQFERDVRVRRPGLVIESDILKVFLRREDDPGPEGAGPDTPLPGQVRSIVATIGKRPGSVVVTGYKIDEKRGTEIVQYTAKGGRADYDYDTNRINLTDSREQRWPEVEFGPDRDRITDGNLTFVFSQVRPPPPPTDVLRPDPRNAAQGETVLDSLTTFGGRGEVVLRTRRQEDRGPTIPTIVNYTGEMSYNRTEGRIRFQDNVNLRRGDLAIASAILDIRLSSDGVTIEPSQVNRIIAETDVEIHSGEYHTRAQRAEYDIYSGPIGPVGTGLDTLRLFGPPQGTPPHPWIRDEAGNQITAPEIHMQRLTTEAGHRDQHLMVARGGVSVCDFVNTPDDPAERPKVVSVKCASGMEYNQSSKKARFEGQVMVTSDDPEDNYVLTSDRLLLDFEESPDPANPGEYETWIRRITAEGSARLMQDNRTCEAINIIRDFPTPDPHSGDIYLQGAAGQAGVPAQLAVYREQMGDQIGSMFAAPLIKSTSRGDLIQANGPGQLSTPEEGSTAAVPLRAEIHFEGAASYESVLDGATSEARFWGGVVLRHPSRNVYVTAEEMDARFIRDTAGPGTGLSTDIEVERIGRLRRVEGRINVRLEHLASDGTRNAAAGDVGVVDFTTTGNIIRLLADRQQDSRRFVMARDSKGMIIGSPEIEVREGQGITRAAGPGDLQIPADQAGGGMAGVPTRVLYGESGSLVYNELALNIRVNDNVRIVQPGPDGGWAYPSLDGICDRLEITLYEPPSAGITGEDALTRVSRMDAVGNVLLRVYADPPANNPSLEWFRRPGTTFFTRGDQALYDVRGGEIAIFCHDNRQPQLLLNIVDENGSSRRQRLKADRFVLHPNTQPRRWNFVGEMESNTIGEGEPFDFSPD